MFATLVSGRLVQTNFSRVSDTQFLIDLSPLNDVNHIVVFLTGESPFPVGFGGGGLLQDGNVNWYFLGVLSNEHPSSIFKIGRLAHKSLLQNGIHPFGDHVSPQGFDTGVQAQLGISVEPLVNLPQQPDGTLPEAASSDMMTLFTRFAAESLFNYVASFANETFANSDPLVPISSIKRWFDTMLQKLALDPSFWRK